MIKEKSLAQNFKKMTLLSVGVSVLSTLAYLVSLKFVFDVQKGVHPEYLELAIILLGLGMLVLSFSLLNLIYDVSKAVIDTLDQVTPYLSKNALAAQESS